MGRDSWTRGCLDCKEGKQIAIVNNPLLQFVVLLISSPATVLLTTGCVAVAIKGFNNGEWLLFGLLSFFTVLLASIVVLSIITMVYDNLIGGYLYLCRDKNGNIHIHKVKPLLHSADDHDQEEYFYFSPRFENSLDSPAEVKLADYRFDWYIRVRRNGLFRRHAIVCVPSKIEERQNLINETKILAFDKENDILNVKVSHLGYASIRLSEFFSIKRNETIWPYLLFAITQSQKSDLRERENLQKSAAAINRQRESDCIHFVIPAIIQLNNRHSGPNALARDVREILEVKLAQDFKADVFAKIIESFRMTVIEKESLSGDDKVKMLGEADALAKRVQALR